MSGARETWPRPHGGHAVEKERKKEGGKMEQNIISHDHSGLDGGKKVTVQPLLPPRHTLSTAPAGCGDKMGQEVQDRS